MFEYPQMREQWLYAIHERLYGLHDAIGDRTSDLEQDLLNTNHNNINRHIITTLEHFVF